MKNKKLIVIVLLTFALIGGAILLQSNGGGTQFLWKVSDGGKWLLPLLGVSAIIDSINPCAFSVLILTIAFLFSIGKLRSRILEVGGIYILGLFLVYLAIGLGVLGTLHLFDIPHFMAKVGATLLIVLGGVNLINEFFPSFPIKLKIPEGAHHKMAELMEKGSMPTAFGLGVLVGLCEFPCTGGPYLVVLGLLHDEATYFTGFAYLVLYNLIFVLPLILILLIASDRGLLDRVQAWQRQESRPMRFWGGIAMVVLGAVIFFL